MSARRFARAPSARPRSVCAPRALPTRAQTPRPRKPRTTARQEGLGSSFFDAVYALVRLVPRGRVVTYGQVAHLLGVARGARAVGWALRALKGGDRPVPWHRVLGQGGRISLGDRPSGLEQRLRLRTEGVHFKGEHVDLARHAWDPLASPARAPQSRAGTSQVSRARRRT